MIPRRTDYIGSARDAFASPTGPGIEGGSVLPTTRRLAVFATLTLLAACNRGADWRDSHETAQSDAPSSGYIRPPQVLAATRSPDGGVTLTGQGAADVRLRLASPDGGAYGATADDGGHWSIALPSSDGVRLFGLSEEIAGRVIQGEGYVGVLPTPGRPAVLLRAGGGAGPLIESAVLQVTAVDFDAAGGAVLSGTGGQSAGVKALIDGRPAGETHVSPHGHYALAVSSVLKPGPHRVQVQSAGVTAEVRIIVGPPPAAVGNLPYRGSRVDGAWRIDWLTPGGGPQTTLVLDPAGAVP